MYIGKWAASAALSCMLVVPVSFAQAQGDPLTTRPDQGDQQRESHDKTMKTDPAKTLISANKLIGMEIRNIDNRAEDATQESNEDRHGTMQGETVGEVGDIVLEPGDNRIAYVVLQYGGFLGMGEKLIAVPWDAFEMTHTFDNWGNGEMADYGMQALYINVPKQDLENAQGFDPEQLPTEASSTFASATDDSREYESRGTQSNEPDAKDASHRNEQRRLSWFLGTGIEGTNGEEMAELNDIVIDTREGRVVYGIVSYGGVAGFFSRLAAVPWKALTVKEGEEMLAMDASAEELDNLVLARGDYHMLEGEEFSREVHSAFDEEPYWYVYGYVAPGPTDEGTAKEDKSDQQEKPSPDSNRVDTSQKEQKS